MQIFAVCWILLYVLLHSIGFSSLPPTHTHTSVPFFTGRATPHDPVRSAALRKSTPSPGRALFDLVLLLILLLRARPHPADWRCVDSVELDVASHLPSDWLTDPLASPWPSVAIAPCRSDQLCRPLSGVRLWRLTALQRHWLLLPSVSLVCITLARRGCEHVATFIIN